MRRLGVIVVIGLSLAASTASSAPEDWDTLPYYNKSVGTLFYATDGTWTGGDPIKNLPLYEWDKHPNFPKVVRKYIWGPTCSKGRERRTFSKKIMVPGAPLNATFFFSYAVSTLQFRPWEGASLRVNGVEIAKLPRTAGVPVSKAGASSRTGTLSERLRKAFRYGENTLTITATKSPLKRGMTRCNDPRVPRLVGVYAELYLEFGADMKVAPPQLPVEIVRNVVKDQAVGLNATLRLTNAGPSAAMAGTLTVNYSGPGISTVQLPGGSSGVGPFQECEGGLNLPLVCQIQEFRPGTTVEVPILAALRVDTAQFRSGAGRINVQVVLGARGLRSVGLGDEVQNKVIVLCAAGATDPACA